MSSTDLSMPGIDGVEFVSRLRGHCGEAEGDAHKLLVLDRQAGDLLERPRQVV